LKKHQEAKTNEGVVHLLKLIHCRHLQAIRKNAK
jgi:hypothetical protein